jgi:hypothetical protein
MNPSLTIALAQSHHQDLRHSAARAQAATEASGPREPLRARLSRSAHGLGFIPRPRRSPLAVTATAGRA